MYISKIKLHNFKRFRDLEIPVEPDMNIFIGDNESGKSSILQAIDLAARGSRRRVEDIGQERLFNVQAIEGFMEGSKQQTCLPDMYVELYFGDARIEGLYGKNNSLHTDCSGIRMRCIPNDDFSQQIAIVLGHQQAVFPLEFYKIEFSTFSGEGYNSYQKVLNTIFIDNSQIGSPYAMREYVRDIYFSHLDETQRAQARHAYHEHKNQFQNSHFASYNAAMTPYAFAIRESSEDNIETDITLTDSNIPLENKGTGEQCFIKTKLALAKKEKDIDAVLIEEPENHLSFWKMQQLIDQIKKRNNSQLFIATHSDMICTRLNLKKCILLSGKSNGFSTLSMLKDDTAKFFMKAPDNNMLQFILSEKAILVEGDAEYILMEALYKKERNVTPEEDAVSVIAVDGKCFKRYLDIAKILKMKVAVITDNDKDYDDNITENYADYRGADDVNIGIYSDTNKDRYTFEVCMYQDNKDICDELFAEGRKKLTEQEYMLNNKAEAAYQLLSKKEDALTVPQYIKDAIAWIASL